MTTRIYKYPVAAEDAFTIPMPAGAKLLSVQVQLGEAQLWAMVDTDAPEVAREFALLGTGHNATRVEVRGGVFVGTFQVHGGELVFHLFDMGEPT